MMPPLERVFESMGVDKSELLGLGKQMVLTSLFGTNPQTGRKSKTGTPSEALESIDGVICDKCGKNYRRPPLVGKCDSCSGTFSFYSGNKKSKHFMTQRI